MCPLDFSCAIHRPARRNGKASGVAEPQVHNPFGIFLGSFGTFSGSSGERTNRLSRPLPIGNHNGNMGDGRMVADLPLISRHDENLDALPGHKMAIARQP